MSAEKKKAAHDDEAKTNKLPEPRADHSSAARPANGAAAPLGFLEIQRNSRERLRVQVKTFKGLEYVDLRVWFVGQDGEYAPSAKGVMLRPSQVVEVAQGLLLAGQAIDPQKRR